MECENSFCVYWLKENCILEKITLDIQGNCQDCVYINIDENTLQKERIKVLQKFQEHE